MNNYPEIIHISFMSYAHIPFRAEIEAKEFHTDWGDGTGQEQGQEALLTHTFPGEGLFEIKISGKDIRSVNLSRLHLNGLSLQHCTALEYLDCSVNEIHTLDISTCPALEELYCNSNNLSGIDFSSQSRLQVANLAYNQLRQLDLSACGELYSLHCNYNYLTGIKLGHSPNLNFINLAGNLIDDCGLNRLFDSLPQVNSNALIYYDRNPGTGFCDPQLFRNKNWQ